MKNRSYTSLEFKRVDNSLSIQSENFAGIGTREITSDGVLAIENLYKNTFNSK